MLNTCCCGKNIHLQASDTSLPALTEKGGRSSRGNVIQPRLGAPLIWLFQRAPQRLPGTRGSGGDLLRQAARTDECPFALPALSSVTLKEAWSDHLPNHADARRPLMTLTAGTSRSLFSSLISKTTEPREFLFVALALGTILASPSSLKTSNSLHISTTMTKVRPR